MVPYPLATAVLHIPQKAGEKEERSVGRGNIKFGQSIRVLKKWLSVLLLVLGLVAAWGVAGSTRAEADTGAPSYQWNEVGGFSGPLNVWGLQDVNGVLYAGTRYESNGVWTYSGGTWTQMNGSPSNVGTFIGVNSMMYAIGTLNGSYVNAVWMFSNGTWTPMSDSPNGVTSLVNVNGTLYAGANYYPYGGVWFYSNGKWTTMNSSPGNVQSLVEDSNGTLYAGTLCGSKDVWMYSNGKWTQMSGSPSNVFSLIDVNGTLYAGTLNGSNAVWMYSNGKWTQMSGSPGNVFSLIDMNGTLYAGAYNGGNDVWSYSKGKWTQTSSSPSYVQSFVNMNGTLYAGASAGVYALQLTPEAPTNVMASNTTSAATTLSWSPVVGATSYKIYENGGSTPIATVGSTSTTYPVSNLKPETWYSFQVTASITNGGESAKSSVNVFTMPSTMPSWPAVGTAGSPSIINSLVDMNGTLYAGTGGNGSNDVWMYSNGKWTQMNGSPGYVDPLIDVNGMLYAGTQGNNGVWTYSNGKWTQMIGSPSNVLTFEEDVNGTLYVGAQGNNGVWTYSNGKWTQMIGSPGNVGTLINVNGTLYTGTQNGSNDVWKYNGSTWTQMNGSPVYVSSFINVNGTLYAGSLNGSNDVWMYSNGTWTQMNGSPAYVSSFINVNGTLYTGSWNESNDVWTYSNGTWTQLSGSPASVSYLIEVNGTIYASTGYGVYSLQIPTNLRMGFLDSAVTGGQTATVTGTVYDVYNMPVPNAIVDLNSTSGDWGLTENSNASVTANVYGDFSTTWTAPSVSNQTVVTVTASVYGNPSVSAQTAILVNPPGGGTVNNFSNVVGSTTASPSQSAQISTQIPGQGQKNATSYVNLSIPAGTFPVSQGVLISSVPPANLNQVAPAGTNTISAVGVDFSGTASKPMTLTIQNSNIQPGVVVYKLLADGTYQALSSGAYQVSQGQVIITFSTDPNFIIAQPLGGGGIIQPYIDTVEITTTATVGQPFSEQLIGGGASVMTWSVIKGFLPSGLTLSSQGVISGTPTAAGTNSFTVQITDASGNHAEMPLSITVNPGTSSSGAGGTSGSGGGSSTGTGTTLVPLAIGTEQLSASLVNASYNGTLSATGGQGTYTWSVVSGTLPAGLSLDAKTGAITGTPKQTGLTKVTIGVTDASGKTVSKELVFDILPANQRQWVWNGNAQDVPVIVGKDSGTETTYMPIWYVMQLLKQVGASSVWDGHNWHITTTKAIDLTNLNPGQGTMGIYLNGTLVQKVNGAYAKDPSTGENTTYMPIWYVMQILNKLSIQSNWNGTTWSFGTQGSSTIA